jgi:hypothetical protein
LFCPFLQFSWREDISNNKKDIQVLLVWDKDSYTASIASMHMCITTWIDSSLPDLFTTSQSHSHSDLYPFKVTILTLLLWTHQILSSTFWVFETRFLCVAHSGLELMIFLPQLPKCWDYKHEWHAKLRCLFSHCFSLKALRN